MSTNQADPKHFESVAIIDSRLAEIEHEKRALLARKEALLKLAPNDGSGSNLTQSRRLSFFVIYFVGGRTFLPSMKKVIRQWGTEWQL